MNDVENREFAPEEKPPLFRQWNKWYMILIYVLIIQVILYYWLTLAYQ